MIIFSYIIVLAFLMMLSVLLPKGRFLPLRSNELVTRTSGRSIFLQPEIMLVLLLISIFSGLRDQNIGIDYSSYIQFYKDIVIWDFSNIYELSGVEIGWSVLNLFFAKLGFPSELFFGLLAFLVWAIFVKSADDFRYLLPLMFFFIFCNGFFLWTLSGLRQTIAIMLFLYATKFIRDKSFLNYMLLIIFGSLFHASILVMIPFYFVTLIRYNRVIAIFLFTISLAFIGQNFSPLLVGQISSLFEVNNISYYQLQLSQVDRFVTVESTGTNLGLLLRTIFTFFILFYGKKIVERNPEFNIYYILFTIYAIVNNLFFSIELFSRLFLYFYGAFFVVSATSIYFSKGILHRILSLFFIVGFSSLYFVTIYRTLSESLLN